MAETGLPPIVWVQRVQLARLQYRLRSISTNPIPYELHRMWRSTWSTSLPGDSLENRMTQAVTILDPERLPDTASLPLSVLLACRKTANVPIASGSKTGL